MSRVSMSYILLKFVTNSSIKPKLNSDLSECGVGVFHRHYDLRLISTSHTTIILLPLQSLLIILKRRLRTGDHLSLHLHRLVTPVISIQWPLSTIRRRKSMNCPTIPMMLSFSKRRKWTSPRLRQCTGESSHQCMGIGRN